jgi:hypothetical protein
MNPSPSALFSEFVGGFPLFISLSFSITYTASKLTAKKEAAHIAAAAYAQRFGENEVQGGPGGQNGG